MPDFQATNVLFGSSFDSTAFVAGVNKSVDSLKGLAAEQTKLQGVFDSTNNKLLETQSELTKTQRSYDNLDKGSKSYIESQNKLKAKIDELKNTSTQLNTTWAAQKAALESFNSTNAAAIASFNKLGAAQKELAATASKPIIPVLDPTQITGQLQSVHDLLAKAGGGQIDFTGFEGLQAGLAAAGNEITQLTLVLDVAKQKLETLDPNTQEFAELNEVVQTGEKFITDYNNSLIELGNTEDKTGEKTVSMRARIKALREEMTRLEDAGKENTEQYKKVQLEAARLTDQFADQQQQVKTLSSDTKALDFGLAAINAAGAGMQVFLGVVNLLGLSEEDAAEAQKKLLAVMNLVQGAQQLQNLLLKEGTIRTLGASLATRAYAAVNGFLATSFGVAATAASVFRGILITTGVGALVVGLGFLVSKLLSAKKEIEETKEAQESLNDIMGEAGGEYKKAYETVDHLRRNIQLAKDGFIDKKKVVEEYNKTIGETTGQVKDLNQAEKELEENAEAYIKFMFLKAAANIAVGKAAEHAFKIAQLDIVQQKIQEAELTLAVAKNDESLKKTKAGQDALYQLQLGLKKLYEQQAKIGKEIGGQVSARQALADIANDLFRQADEISKGFKITPKVTIEKKGPDNVFKEQLLAMEAQLANLKKSVFISIETITAKVEADYKQAKQKIIEFLNAGKLTEEQTDILMNFLGVISDAQLKKETDEFNKAVLDAKRKLKDELDNLAFAQSTRNINNIQDSFERESEQNKLEFEKQTADLIRANDDQIQAIKENIFLSEDEKNTQILARKDILNKALTAQEIAYHNDQRDLALKFLLQSVDDISKAFDERGLRTNELEQKSIKLLNEQYLNGEISFKEYQKGLTRIQTEAQEVRKKSEVDEIQKKIAELQALLAKGTIKDKTGVTEKLNAEQLQALRDKIIALQKELDALLKGKGIEPPATTGLDKALEAYQKFATAIIGFMNDINAAEQQRLERSIALQQTRVENARFIAEKGNAEYLELEQKRLDALIAKREAAANKEMAINNALAASSAIVAAITAIAQATKPPGNAILGIAAAAAVLTAIGTIYKFVSSLQPPVSEFAEGTMYVQQGKHKQGKDTIPARLTVGEAVIPADRNKAYSEAVKAIYTRSVPASVLNEFVAQYPVTRIPKVDYGRLQIATERSYGKDISTSKIEELLMVLHDSIEGKEPIKMKIDHEGFSVEYEKTLNRRKRMWKA